MKAHVVSHGEAKRRVERVNQTPSGSYAASVTGTTGGANGASEIIKVKDQEIEKRKDHINNLMVQVEKLAKKMEENATSSLHKNHNMADDTEINSKFHVLTRAIPM